jgi:hypothetical protein
MEWIGMKGNTREGLKIAKRIAAGRSRRSAKKEGGQGRIFVVCILG